MTNKLKIVAAAAFTTVSGFLGTNSEAEARGERPDPKQNRITNKFNDVTLVYHVRKGLLQLGNRTYRVGAGNRKGHNNPAYEKVTDVGPPPRGTYEVTPREAPFFGTDAWRVLDTPGRTGILIHTDAIGLKGRPPGESKGCIVVQHKHWKRFVADMERLEPTRIIIK